MNSSDRLKRFPWVAALLCILSAACLVPASSLAEEPIIPLCPGLKIVTAVNQRDGDYESIKRVVSNDEQGIFFHYSSERTVLDDLSGEEVYKVSDVARRVTKNDQEGAASYLVSFQENIPEIVPGTTAIGISVKKFKELKKTGRTEVGLIQDVYPNVQPHELLESGSILNIFNGKIPIQLEAPDKTPSPMRVLVNGKIKELPVIRAVGDQLGFKVEFFILDDVQNPMVLKFRLGVDAYAEVNKQAIEATGQPARPSNDKSVLQVVRISFDCSGIELPDMSGDGKPIDASGAEGELKLLPQGAGIGEGSGRDGKAPDLDEASTTEPKLLESKQKDHDTGAGSADLGSAIPAQQQELSVEAPALSETAKAIETSLTKGEVVDIYDIFFNFNRSDIRPESDETLTIISDLLTRHPDWKLALGGHTDSIASDSYNLDLSNRRAAAVKVALVTRFKVDPARLSTQGFGESMPRDTNETLEGRARNRRVELKRL